MLNERIEELYKEFKGLPSNKPIVRINQRNDAFVLLVAEVLFKDYHDIVYSKDNLKL